MEAKDNDSHATELDLKVESINLQSIEKSSGCSLLGTLQGHSKTVLCLDSSASQLSSGGNLLCSGSEDSTIRIWDIRDNNSFKNRAIRSLIPSNEQVNSVSFYSSNRVKVNANKKSNNNNDISFDEVNEFFVFAACDKKIFCFDLRNPSIVLKESVQLPIANTDEINHIVARGDYLAACDDSGEIKIFSLEEFEAILSKTRTPNIYKTLRKQHTNICTCVKFRPTKPWEVVSGGLDCHAILWDFSRGKPLAAFNPQQDNVIASGKNSLQIVNPPFVHSLDISSNGSILALGLGNHSIGLYNLNSKRVMANFEAHTATVSQIIFPYFEPSSHIISGGNDGQIMLWDIPQDLIEAATVKKVVTSSTKKKEKKEPEEVKEYSPTLTINHKSKINWLTTSLNGNLFVADQSEKISVYSVRL